MRSIIVADGDIHPGAALSQAVKATDLVIAADGGALKALSLGLRPDVVVGDGDSLAADQVTELRDQGVEVVIHPVDKDESDTELAVREALARGATSVVIVGAFGGARLEHSVANLLLLTLPELAGMDAALVDGPTTVRVIGVTGADDISVAGAAGDYVSLLALSASVTGVTTNGLRFPLADAELRQGSTHGLSNELSSSRGEIRTRHGRLAVIHTRMGEQQ